MDSTLHALGGILLKAVPTFLLVVLLNFYLKSVFFKPMEKILQKRHEATVGARALAEQSQERATAKTVEYEAALRAARSEVYQAQDVLRRQLDDVRAAEAAAARKSADAAIGAAKAELAADVAGAKLVLAGDAESLSQQIAESVLRRSAA